MSGTQTWHDQFLDWLFTTQPVSATFVGERGHDHAWPDLSVSGISATAERAQQVLNDVGGATGNGVDALDALLMQSHLFIHL